MSEGAQLCGSVVVRTDSEISCPGIDAGLRNLGAELILLPGGTAEDELLSAVGNTELLLTCYQPVTARVIAAAPALRGVVKYGVGVDAIDIDAAIRHRVPVVNVPGYAEDTVAEAAFTLILALAKQLRPIERAVRSLGWLDPVPRWLGRDIAGSTVGIVGTGRIGRALARMVGQGCRARVLGFDPHVPADRMRDAGIEKVGGLHELLGASDFVSLHATLTPQSRHLICAEELACMRLDAYLVNVSRGELVDEQALLRALRDGRIAGAGLDVYGQEPLTTTGHPLSDLLTMDNVLLTPHLAFYTAEAMQRLEAETIERCVEALSSGPVLVRSHDPRLRAQVHGVRFDD